MFDQSLAETAIQYIQEPFCAVFNSDFVHIEKNMTKVEIFYFLRCCMGKTQGRPHYYTSVQINIPHVDLAPWIKK